MFGYDRIIVNVAEQIIKAAPLQQHQKFPAEDVTSGLRLYDRPQKAVNATDSATKTADTPAMTTATATPTVTTKKSSAPSFVNGFLTEYSQYIQHQKQLQQGGPGLQMFSPKSIDSDDSTRRLSGGSNSYGDCSGVDCGASSGYGSPGVGGTPLASPAPNSAHYFAHQLQRILLDQELNDQNTLPRDMNSAGANAQSVLTIMKGMGSLLDDIYEPGSPNVFGDMSFGGSDSISGGDRRSSTFGTIDDKENSKWSSTADQHLDGSTVTPTIPNSGGDALPPVTAANDTFSPPEIAQYTQLLRSSKKPPPHYLECQICFQSGHCTSNCPTSVLTMMGQMDRFPGNIYDTNPSNVFDEMLFGGSDSSTNLLPGGGERHSSVPQFVDQKDCSNSDGKWSVTPSDGGSSAPTVTPTVNNAGGGAPVIAVEDGFSASEIAQFAQLLCSPKKAPPQRYQCHICYQSGHYISDCPMRFNSPYEELTPYQGRKKCYGEFQCQVCKRKWTSQNSVANEAQSCIKCHVAVFPHKQLPVDKAIALGLVKSHRVVPAKITPIGHGRPPAGPSTATSQSHHREN